MEEIAESIASDIENEDDRKEALINESNNRNKRMAPQGVIKSINSDSKGQITNIKSFI